MASTQARVLIWEQQVALVEWDDQLGAAHFQYLPEWRTSGVELAPLQIPLNVASQQNFKNLSFRTFKGLPGLLSDSLPDRFGNMLLDAWRVRNGISEFDFNPVQRLCYIGRRGMGALEFEPVISPQTQESARLHLEDLVEVTRKLLTDRERFAADMSSDQQQALDAILRVGTSAGGARAKALIAWNAETGEVRSGQVEAPPGFEHYLLKFDGVIDRALGDPKGFGRLEYAYHLMAKEAGIDMMDCSLLEEGGRAHFVTRRFDRDGSEKLHAQSLCALAHLDFNEPGAVSYEQAFAVTRKVAADMRNLEQFYRRMVFNVLARNQDDHTRNFGYVMDRSGNWSLGPAYDVAWNYRASSEWVSRHQMSVNGKTDGFVREDLLAAGKAADLRRPEDVIDQVAAAVNDWLRFAAAAGVDSDSAKQVAATHRMELALKQSPKRFELLDNPEAKRPPRRRMGR